jgi:hypothetical protein
MERADPAGSGVRRVEDLGEGTREARQNVLAIERPGLIDHSHRGEPSVGGGLPRLEVEHPDQTHSGLQVLADLVEDKAGLVTWRHDLDRQIGRERWKDRASRPAATKLTSGARRLPPGRR